MFAQEILVAGRLAADVIFGINNAGLLLVRMACQRRQQGNAVAAGGNRHSGGIRQRSQPVMELSGLEADLALGNAGGPAYQRGNAHSAFPAVALDAVHHAVTLEKLRILRPMPVLGVGAAFIVGAIVGGKDNHRIVVDLQILQQMNQIRHGIIHAADHRGMPFGHLIREAGIVRINVRVLVFFRLGVKSRIYGFRAVLLHPLQAAFQTAAGRIGRSGNHQVAVRGRKSQVQEKRLAGLAGGLALVHNPLLGAGGKQIRGIGGLGNLVLDILPFGIGGVTVVLENVAGFGRIMEMPGQMVQDAVKIIEAALVGAARHRTMAFTAAAHAPFADGGGIITGVTHHGAQRMGIFNGMVKAVVPHHAGIPLVHPQQQGGARRSADRSGGIMPAQLNSLPGQRGQSRGLELVLPVHRPPVQLLLAPVGIQIAPAHIVYQNKNNIGF